MSNDQLDELRNGIRRNLTGERLDRFDAEARLFDALLANKLARERLAALEKLAGELAKAMK